MIWRQRCWPLWMIILVLCSGCAGSGISTAYYTLQSAPSLSVGGKDPRAASLVIGMGPVMLPRHLDRDAIVTRISANQLKVNDGHRWAGSLNYDIVHGLATHLEGLGQVKEVVVFPWPTRVEPDLRFRVDILAFEGVPDKEVTLKAAWSMAAGSSSPPAFRRILLVKEEIRGISMEEMVAAMGRALAQLAQEMVAAIATADP